MYCNNCKYDCPEDATYCPCCGKKLKNIERPKEKVKFRHQFLIPILILVGCFEIETLSHTIDAGLYCSYLGVGWINFFICIFITDFFGAWSERLISNFSGSEYLKTFGIKKEYFEYVEKFFRKVIPVLEIIFAAVVFVRMFINGFSFRFIQVRPIGDLIRTLAWTLFYNIMAPAFEMKTFILIIGWCRILKNISKVTRPVTKKEMRDEDTESDESVEHFFNRLPIIALN